MSTESEGIQSQDGVLFSLKISSREGEKQPEKVTKKEWLEK